MGLAMLPDTFTTCYRAESIPSFNALTCYLLGGGFRPPMDICCKGCPGHQFVLSARKADQERTGGAVDLVQFYRERINWREHPWIARIRSERWAEAMGI
jgi:hypothetical protein